jgi:methyl-accepting chemotaxis protein
MVLSIKQTFVVASVTVAALSGVTVGSLLMSSQQRQEAQLAATQRYQSFLLADELRQSSDDLTRLARTFVVSNAEAKWEQQYFEILDIRNGKRPRPQDYERIYWDFRAAGSEAPRPPGAAVPLTELMKQAGFTAQELAKLDEAKANSDALVKTETIAMNLAKGLTEDGHPGDPAQLEANRAQARAMMHDLAYHQNKARIMKPVDEFFVLLNERTAAAVARADADAQFWGRIAVAATLLMVVSLLGILIGTDRRVGRLLAKANQIADGIAEGRVDQRIEADRGGEEGLLLGALDRMQHQLSTVIASIRRAADSVASASSQIANGNRDLSSRTEQQAAGLEQAAASMEELGATVRQNADSARQGNQLAQGASEVAQRGGAVVAEVVDTMKGINDSSRRIADIIGVIDGLAFQTNILALNAAVEAARAGEQGRGFAVVAGEVRSLAQRSAEAAREIKTLITASVERVEQGSALVDQAGATMQDIVSHIHRVTDLMAEISSASEQQRSGVDQVGDVVAHMDQATQQNAALVEQSAAAAESLRSQAAQLVQAVAVFRLQDHGDGPQAPARRAAPALPDSLTQTVHKTPVAKVAPSRTPVAAKPVLPSAATAGAPAPTSVAPVASPAASVAAASDDWETF